MVRVTEILSILDYGAPKDRMELQAPAGRLLHRHVLTKLAGFYLPPPHPYILHYVNKTLVWCERMIEEIIIVNGRPAVEIKLVDSKLGLIGHGDIIAALRGYKYPYVLDFKRVSSLHWITRLQLAAYHHMAEQMLRRKLCRAAVHIPVNGEIKMWEPPSRVEDDWAGFLNCMMLYGVSKS